MAQLVSVALQITDQTQVQKLDEIIMRSHHVSWLYRDFIIFEAARISDDKYLMPCVRYFHTYVVHIFTCGLRTWTKLCETSCVCYVYACGVSWSCCLYFRRRVYVGCKVRDVPNMLFGEGGANEGMWERIERWRKNNGDRGQQKQTTESTTATGN